MSASPGSRRRSRASRTWTLHRCSAARRRAGEAVRQCCTIRMPARSPAFAEQLLDARCPRRAPMAMIPCVRERRGARGGLAGARAAGSRLTLAPPRPHGSRARAWRPRRAWTVRARLAIPSTPPQTTLAQRGGAVRVGSELTTPRASTWRLSFSRNRPSCAHLDVESALRAPAPRSSLAPLLFYAGPRPRFPEARQLGERMRRTTAESSTTRREAARGHRTYVAAAVHVRCDMPLRLSECPGACSRRREQLV